MIQGLGDFANKRLFIEISIFVNPGRDYAENLLAISNKR